jgi:hypothetical protein
MREEQNSFGLGALDDLRRYDGFAGAGRRDDDDAPESWIFPSSTWYSVVFELMRMNLFVRRIEFVPKNRTEFFVYKPS